MGFLCNQRVSRKMQRTLKNFRVSFLCFLLTFLVLRNTIGAGKFGTPAQDFEEIRQHLHYVGLHRRHFRVLAEAVEEEEKRREAPMLTLERRPPLIEENGRQKKAPLHALIEKQGNAVAAMQSNAALSTSRSLQGGVAEENVGFQKDPEGSGRIRSWDMQRKMKGALPHGSYEGSRLLLVTEVLSSNCKNPAGEHFLLKSLKNKVDYSTLHGLEISLSFGSLDPEMAKPISKLSLLQSSMSKYPHIEWLWWIPHTALITDMAFALPVQNYTEFNLVLLGSDDDTHHQKGFINLNTDSFLIRNCRWSLDLLRTCASKGNRADRLLTNSLLRGPHLEAGDQPALIYLFEQDRKGLANNVNVMPSAVKCGEWRSVAKKFEWSVKQSQRGIDNEKLPFVMHFLGCDVCQKVGDKEGGRCVKQMERAFAFAEKQGVPHKSLSTS